MMSDLRRRFADLFSPLMLAGYAAWLAVWFSMASRGEVSLLARLLALGFLLVFVVRYVFEDRFSLGLQRALTVSLSVIALALTAVNFNSSTPILLVVAAGALASQLNRLSLVLALVVINAVFAMILHYHWPEGGMARWTSLGGLVSFQVFAAVVMHSAKRAQTMSERLREVNAELIATRSLLEESARDAERLRLSRELHDVAGHGLTALKLNLGALLRDARQPDVERVRLCAELVDELLRDLRGVVRQMRDHEGIHLRTAIERLVAPFPQPRIHLALDEDAKVNDMPRAEALLRVVQEGVTNAVRHAGATQLWLTLKRAPNGVQLIIHDDGTRLKRLPSFDDFAGAGLRGMRERLHEYGGELHLDLGERGGLRLTAMLPQENA